MGMIKIMMIFFGIIFGIVVGKFSFHIYSATNVQYHGPNSTTMKNKIYKDKMTNKCYSFEPYIYMCPIL